MYRLFDNESGTDLGVITPEQLQFLTDHLEEESAEDRDYYINTITVDSFQAAGADEALLAMLRQAMGDRGEMEIRWARVAG